LNTADLERFALRYVERYATTRGRLADYLRRKIRERGWGGEATPDVMALAQRMADLGYVNDRLFARRVGQALRHAGIEDSDLDAVTPVVEASAISSAVAFARRKHIGPFARQITERPEQEKQLAAMLRAGHPFELSRKIVRMSPGDDLEALSER
jgi:regulatory protein